MNGSKYHILIEFSVTMIISTVKILFVSSCPWKISITVLNEPQLLLISEC